jgi:hypothetical protein
MALLDGKIVPDEDIDPAKHDFLGMFRYPYPPDPGGYDLLCPCGAILKYVGEKTEHWRRGHFDIPLYTWRTPTGREEG